MAFCYSKINLPYYISTQKRKCVHPQKGKEYPPKGERISTQRRKVIHPRAKEYPPKFKKIKIAFFSKPQLNTGENGNELNAKNPIYILLIYIFNSNLDDDDREYNNHHLSSSSFWFFFLQSEFWKNLKIKNRKWGTSCERNN